MKKPEATPAKVVSAPAKPKPAQGPRSSAERRTSFKFILGYLKRECCQLILGLFFMLGAALVDIVTPIFIGRIIDYMREGNWDAIGELCLY